VAVVTELGDGEVIAPLLALTCKNIPPIMVVIIAPTVVIIATITDVLLKMGLLLYSGGV